MKIVPGIQPRAQDFIGPGQVMQVGAAVVAAGVTLTLLIQGPLAAAVRCIAYADVAGRGKQVTIARVASGHDTIEHIHPALHCGHQVFGRARRPSGNAGRSSGMRVVVCSSVSSITSAGSPTDRPPTA